MVKVRNLFHDLCELRHRLPALVGDQAIEGGVQCLVAVLNGLYQTSDCARATAGHKRLAPISDGLVNHLPFLTHPDASCRSLSHQSRVTRRKAGSLTSATSSTASANSATTFSPCSATIPC